MRNEAKLIYDQLQSGKTVTEIDANPKTKAKIHRVFLYRKLMNKLIDDMQTGHYTFSTYEIQKLLKPKNDGR